MEFPEKIYVFDNPVLDFSLLGENRHESDVEYIRKDVVDDMLKTAEDHAYFAGSEAMKEKMIEDAIEVEVLTAWSDGEANVNIPIDAEKGDIIKVEIDDEKINKSNKQLKKL